MSSASTLDLPQPCLGTSEPQRPQVDFRPPPKWKRFVDVVGSICLLTVLAPVFLVLAIYIKCVSRGPVIFSQRRIGAGTKEFVIYKFRTMEHNNLGSTHCDYIAELAKQDIPAKKPSYGARLISGGGLIRKLSLDELPQLFNVLMGNMSLVGPRPEVLKLEHYEPWQLRRFEVLPGISGLWQVSGKNKLTFNEMIRLDIRYIDEMKFSNDLRIMLKTVALVALPSNE